MSSNCSRMLLIRGCDGSHMESDASMTLHCWSEKTFLRINAPSNILLIAQHAKHFYFFRSELNVVCMVSGGLL